MEKTVVEAGETSPGRLTTNQASALAFLTAASTLALQVLIYRIVSAKLLNNYAFLVISLTMLGFAISGVILTAFPKLASRRLKETLLVSSCLLGLSAVIATGLFTASKAQTQVMFTRMALVESSSSGRPTRCSSPCPARAPGSCWARSSTNSFNTCMRNCRKNIVQRCATIHFKQWLGCDIRIWALTFAASRCEENC